ncbi:hypothetical protein [Ochrobactrum sp. MYb379]|uniref:hypothetical protein n=1 Tax=Ochrobactrum sp. MYb379 TaxID=2745275 RepID=UPI00309F164D
MPDNIDQMPKSNLECQTTAFGSGKGKIFTQPFQLQSQNSECSLFSLRKITESSHSLKVPSCFLPGKLPAGCSSVAIVFRDTKFPKPYSPAIASDGNDAHELWNEVAISNAMLISKIENINEQLTAAAPVNFVRVR